MTISRSIRLSLIARPDDLPVSAGRSLECSRTGSSTDYAVNHPWEEHLDVVYRYTLRLTRDSQQASDLAQETILRGWVKRRELREPEAARVWLLRIATNLWTDWLRSKKVIAPLLDEAPCQRSPSASGKLIQQEQVALALAALDELPERQRQVLHLITVEQMTHGEVASILEISSSAVKANLAAARKAMRDRLKDVYEEVMGTKRCRTTN